eukprot:TRINITY_DN1807_c0_g1_i1.p1 TRINITY_DN1807_c0_g1~~TRINITY_DN1807_c0_g1_i1.p1  ORF type:complete len:705 (+),score=352.09 TRINITY_DN1807_c0_g1_i1:425-2539(+)
MRFLVLILLISSTVSAGSSWSNPISGLFGSSNSWLGGLLPGLNVPTVISAIGDPFTVIVNEVTSLPSLVLGGVGSAPTLLIDGVTLTVPDLLLVSGNIKIINGGILNCTNLLTINTTGIVNIDVDLNIATKLLGNLNILQGNLVLNGVIDLVAKIEVGLGGILCLNGTHTISTCDITGSGIVQLLGNLIIDPSNLICSIETSVFQLLGGTISSVTSKTLQCNKLAILDDLINTVDGCLIVAADVVINAGVLDCINGGGLNVIGNLVASVSANVAKITGLLNVNGLIDLKVGVLILENILVQADISVDIAAKLLFNNANCTRGIFNLNGLLEIQGILNINAQLQAAISILGGEIQVLGNILVNSGIFNLKNCTTNGPLSIAQGAILQLEAVIWVATDILNAGTVIVDGLLQLPSTCNLTGLPGSTLLNKGIISAVADINVLGLLNLNGIINVTLGNLNLKGSHVISDTCQILGNVNLIESVLNVQLGNLQVLGNVVVGSKSSLISLLDVNANVNVSVLGLDILADASAIVSNPLTVLGMVTVRNGGLLQNLNGALKCKSLNLIGDTCQYVVDILNLDLDVQLDVDLDVQLAGILNLNVSADVNLQVGDVIPILQCKSLLGKFDQVLFNGMDALNPQSLTQVLYTPTSLKMARVAAAGTSDETLSNASDRPSEETKTSEETQEENGVNKMYAGLFTFMAAIVLFAF